ncbi:MAG TPA: tetratricopeptide repeat protein [Geobacteraceae bacterium]
MKYLISAIIFALPLLIGTVPAARADYAAGLRAYGQRDYDTAVRLLKADGGADAAYLLGIMYYRGDGVKADKAEAVRWLRRAADTGHVRAQNNLGMMYDKGDGVPQDQKEAAAWYRKAAEKGHAPSQFDLGLMYTNGEGVAKDHAEAVKWLRKAAKQGHVNARKLLNVMGER